MVETLEDGVVDSPVDLVLFNRQLRDGIYMGNPNEAEGYSLEREKCRANGEHRKPIQITKVTDDQFGMYALRHGISQDVVMRCESCKHTYSRDINAEEHREYQERQKGWKELQFITFDI
tara:strand:+ start:1195 stop:1551 length:357 start_codon:yes stop_codon:yes gene_type:complete